MSRRIIDFHNHAFPEKIERRAIEHLEKHYSINIPRRGRMEDLLVSARDAGISHMVLHASATHKTQVTSTNQWVSAHAKGNVIGFGTLHPDYGDCLGEIKRIKELGLRGIKLHPDFQGFDVDEPSMYPIYEALEPGFPILVHVGDEKLDHSSPRRLARVIKLFPHLTIIGAHLGGYSRWNEAKKYLVGKNLYLDTSSSLWRLDASEAADIIRNHGTDRVLFGSDYPVGSHKREIEMFLNLPLTEDGKKKILWDNAANLLIDKNK